MRIHLELWWWFTGGRGGESAVDGGEVHASGVDGAGRGDAATAAVEAVGKERRLEEGDVVPPPAK